MILTIENSDFFETGLNDVAEALLGFVQEEKSFINNKRIRNILDDLDSFNISFILEDVDTLAYTTLLSMKNISVGLVPNDISFVRMEFPNEKFEKEYERLITEYVEIQRELIKLNMSKKEIEYLEPNSKLVNIRVSASIKDLFYFFLTCGKYDELMDILVIFSNYDELMEKLVTIAMSLDDVIVADDLFIRMKLDDENRQFLLDSVGENIRILSNEEYIEYCVNNYANEVKLSTIGSCSLVAYRDIVDNVPKQGIKIENMYDFIEQEQFRVVLPRSYAEIEGDLANKIDQYIYNWYMLVYNLKTEEGTEHIQMLCCLGCFNHVFKMNVPIYSYFEMDTNELTEVEELMSIVQHKLLNE